MNSSFLDNTVFHHPSVYPYSSLSLIQFSLLPQNRKCLLLRPSSTLTSSSTSRLLSQWFLLRPCGLLTLTCALPTLLILFGLVDCGPLPGSADETVTLHSLYLISDFILSLHHCYKFMLALIKKGSLYLHPHCSHPSGTVTKSVYYNDFWMIMWHWRLE